MAARTPTSVVPTRTVLVLVGAVLVVLTAAGWVGVVAVGAINHAAGRPPAEMIRAVPATYQPLVRPVAQVRRFVPAPMGDWTAHRGVRIAERALRWRNWPYSFAAGSADGPSYGTPVDHDSRNDGNVYGFDCSGLTMYAVAPWRNLAHDAATQYTEVGSYHPAIDSLQPGDLVFWSKDGTIGGIGHVAIYVGNGLVVQAPHSGDVIRLTPIYQVESGTMGATRPLT